MNTFNRWIGALAAFLLVHVAMNAQDYRTVASGNWNALGTWEQFNGTSWVPATTVPTSAAGAINIRSPHEVTVTTGSYNLEEVTIEFGGTLTNTTGTINWHVNNGTFGVKVFGTLNANSAGGSFGCCASVSVEGGGFVYMNAGGSFFGPTVVQGNGTVIGNTPINLAAGSPVNNGTWTMTGSNTLTNTAGANFINNGTLTLRGFSLGGTLTNNGTMAWSAGGISGSGSIQNNVGGTFNISISGVNILSANSTNAGTINYSGTGAFNQLNSNTFSSSGTLNITSGIWDSYGNQAFNGPIVMSAGTQFRVQSGGTTSLNAGSSIGGTGTFALTGGTLNQVPAWSISTHTVQIRIHRGHRKLARSQQRCEDPEHDAYEQRHYGLERWRHKR
ncbi:MAG: hypothetical protein IPM68_19445 [Flavobacteriales bacterium]|nr:hypothetical protein [Flavobacteriales bacterium]